jgi:hypothetical protein
MIKSSKYSPLWTLDFPEGSVLGLHCLLDSIRSKFQKNCYPNYELISLKARQLQICEAVALDNHTLLRPVIYQSTIKYNNNNNIY